MQNIYIVFPWGLLGQSLTLPIAVNYYCSELLYIYILFLALYDAMQIVLHIHMGIHIETTNTIMSLDSNDSITQMMNTFVYSKYIKTNLKNLSYNSCSSFFVTILHNMQFLGKLLYHYIITSYEIYYMQNNPSCWLFDQTYDNATKLSILKTRTPPSTIALTLHQKVLSLGLLALQCHSFVQSFG